jgi:hypothetical protein
MNVSTHDMNISFSNISTCPQATDEELEELVNLHFILEGVLQCLISCLGVVGNTISIVLLLGRELKNSFTKLLAILAVFDLIYLFTMVIDSLSKLGLKNNLHILMFPHFLHPLNSISMMCSIYMTVGVALERYRAVYYPLDYNRRKQDTTSYMHRFVTLLCPLMVFAFLFNIPKFFESEVIYHKDGNTTEIYLDVTELRMNDGYVTWYINYARLIVLGLLPFTAISFLNTKIYLAIRRRRKGRRRPDDNLSIVLVIIVAVFIICNLPRLILNMHEITVIQDVNRCQETDLGGFPTWSIALGFFSHVFLVFNSSINLVIYCMVGAKFRSVFFQRILGRVRVDTFQCLHSDTSQCKRCGRRMFGLRTVQRSKEDENRKREDNGKMTAFVRGRSQITSYIVSSSQTPALIS